MNRGILDSGGRNNNHKKKKNADVGIGSFTKSGGTLNGTNPLKDVVSSSVIDEPMAMEVQSPLVDNTNAVKSGVGSYPSLPTQGTTPAGNTLESIRAISERFVNTVYGFFLGKRVAYPVVANDVRNTWGKFGLVKSMLNSSTGLFSFKFSSMEDVGNVPLWVKLHGVPVTAFSEDGLSAIATKLGTPLMLDSYTSYMCLQSWGRSSYARAMIELRAEVELKDTIVVAMPKIIREGYNCTVRVEYEWKPPRCLCCKVFGHIKEECPKNIGMGVAKNLKKPSQTSRGVPVAPKVGFKPTKEYRHVPKKLTANSSGNKKKGVDPTNEISSDFFDKKYTDEKALDYEQNEPNMDMFLRYGCVVGKSNGQLTKVVEIDFPISDTLQTELQTMRYLSRQADIVEFKGNDDSMMVDKLPKDEAKMRLKAAGRSKEVTKSCRVSSNILKGRLEFTIRIGVLQVIEKASDDRFVHRGNGYSQKDKNKVVTDINKKDKNQAKTDKIEHGME
ncbi:hypothetical protein Tco_1121953 [Tanacetum coccineum]|uniref:DUF4283 domain-containing protein n=1 Tax=Tanacetum coccineum TaxID=301880 RepID=A0ABQ5J241_9ASTR